MARGKKYIDIQLIDILGATIVQLMGEVGVFHYNKLSFLFEYFFIKNFGRRFTKEKFIKLPHGPVVPNYKKRIKALVDNGYLLTNVDQLMQRRKLDNEDDWNFIKIPIQRTNHTIEIAFRNPLILKLLSQIIERYGNLPASELEELVYSTQVMKNFMKSPFKKEGSYILTSDVFKIKSERNPKSESLYRLIQHYNKYSNINLDNEVKLTEINEFFSKLRSGTWETLENS